MTTSETAGIENATEDAPKPRRKRRFLKWILRFVWILVGLVVLARLTLPLWLPSVLNGVCRDLGLECTYEEIDLSLLRGDIEIRRLDLHFDDGTDETPTTPPWVHLEYARVDVDMFELLGLGLRVHRVEVDGLDVRLERMKNGQFKLPEPIEPPEPDEPEPEPEPEAEVEEPTPFDLSSPVIVDAARIQHVRVHLVDEVEEFETWIESTVRVSDVGHPDRDARITVASHSPDVLDALWIDVRAQMAPTTLDSSVHFEMRGMRPGPIAGMLSALGLRPATETLDINAELTMAARSNAERPAMTAGVSIRDIVVDADGDQDIGVDQVQIDIAHDPSKTSVSQVLIDGTRAGARRLKDGTIRALGFDLVPAPPSTEQASMAQSSTEQASTAQASAEPVAAGPVEPGEPHAFELGQVTWKGGLVAFRDDAVNPPTTLSFSIDELTAASDPNVDPGILGILLAADGKLMPGDVPWHLSTSAELGDVTKLDVDFDLDSLDLTAFDPWLQPGGLRGEATGAKAKIESEVTLRDDGVTATAAVALTEIDTTLTASIRADIGFGDAETTVKDATVSVEASALRDEAGAMHFAGLATCEATAPVAATAKPAPPANAAPAPSQPAADAPTEETSSCLRITRFVLENTKFTLMDAVHGEAGTIVADVSASTHDLVIGGTEALTAPLQLDVGMGAIGAFKVSGQIESRPGPLDLSADIRLGAEKLDLTKLEPWLEGSGIEPTMQDGTFDGQIRATARQSDGTMFASLALTDVAIREGADALISLDGLEVAGVEAGAEGTTIESVSITKPRLSAHRDADGTLHAVGIAIPPAPTPAAGETPAPTAGTGNAPAQSSAAAAPNGAAAEPASFRLEAFTLDAATIAWRDDAAREPVATNVIANVTTQAPIEMGETAQLRLDLQIEELLESMRIDVTSVLDPDRPVLDVKLESRGLRGGWIDHYLPPGQTMTLQDGRLALTAHAELEPSEDGGSRIGVSMTDLSLRDGDSEPLLAAAEISAAIPRLDAEGGQILVDSILAKGLEADVKHRDNVWLAAGLRVAPPPATESPAPPTDDPTPAEPATAPSGPVAAPSEPTPPPHVEIGRLELEFARLRITDGDAEPVEATLSVRNAERLMVIDPEPEELPAWLIEVRAGVKPIVGEVALDISAALWHEQPHFVAKLAATGLNGEALRARLPQLSEGIDASRIADGKMTADLDAILNVRRRVATDFDLSNGFGLEATIDNVAFHPVAEGPPAASIGSIFVDAPRIMPGGGVHVATLEVDAIQGAVTKSPAGMELLGLTIEAPPAPPEATGEDSGEAATPPADAEAAEPTGVPEPAPAEEGPAIRLDRLMVSGLDFKYRDETTDPPTDLPLNDLDVQVDGLRTSGEPSPVRFSVALRADKVELPVRHKAGNLLSGFVSSAADAIGGAEDEMKTEQRALFDEISLTGRVTPGAAPQGLVRLSINELELTGLRGLAKQGGVEIGDGIFNGGIAVRLDPKNIRTTADFTFGDLVVDEPPGGPISTYLKLPASLQSVLFVLKNDADEISVPLDVTMQEGELSTGEIATAGVTAFGSIVADAIASSPFRVAGTVTGLFGGDEDEGPPPEATVTLAFEPGLTSPPDGLAETLAPLLEVLEDDEGYCVVMTPVLSAADLKRADGWANPEPEDRSDIIKRLRDEKRRLWIERDSIADEIMARRALGHWTRKSMQRLRDVDGRLGAVESGLDEMLQLARTGAERRAPRRARKLAIDLGRARGDELREALRALGVENVDERVEIRNPRLPQDDAPASITLTPRKRASDDG